VWGGAFFLWVPFLLYFDKYGHLGDFIIISLTIYAVGILAVCLTVLLLVFRVPFRFYRWLDLGILYVCAKIVKGWEYIFTVQIVEPPQE
jgi:hypothetical protein